MKLCASLAVLLFVPLVATAGTGPSRNRQLRDGPTVADLSNVADMIVRDVYAANGERIGELSEIVLDDAHRPIAASIATDEGASGKEYIVGAEKLRLKGSRLVINLTRQQLAAIPSGND